MQTSPESKWTKGPLTARPTGGDEWEVMSGEYFVALCLGSPGPNGETSEANAHLIASAPDLYEALKAAVECGMVPISSASEGGAARHSRQVEVADMIRAAIAKAEGR